MSNCVSRADILQYLDDTSNAELVTILDCFGYKTTDPKPQKNNETDPLSNLEIPEDIAEVVQEPEEQEETPQVKRPPEYFYTVKEDVPSELSPDISESDEIEMPEWVHEIKHKPLDLSAPIRPANKKAPNKIPLVTWSRLWPVLRQQLSDQQTKNKPDIPKLVKQLSYAKQSHRIPKVKHRHWSDRIILLKDRPERLDLFNQDYNDIEQQLQRMRGKEVIDSYLIDDYPVNRVFGKAGKQEWQMPSPDTPILILSDLGVYDETGEATKQWLSFATKLKAAACTATVLMPVPVRYLSQELSRSFQCIVWDRYSSLTVLPVTGHHEEAIAEQKQQDAKYQKNLLKLLSPASEIDAKLIRAMRYEVDHQDSVVQDIASEAVLWSHPDSEPASNFITITFEKHQEYRDKLTELLAQNNELALQIYNVLKANLSHKLHFDLYEALACTEAFIGDKAKAKNTKLIQKAGRYLKQFTYALHKQPENAGLLYQAYYFLERQSKSHRQDNPYLSSLWAIIKRCAQHNLPRPENIDTQAAHPFLNSNAEVKHYQLVQWGENLILGTKEALQKQQVAGFTAKGQLLAEFKTKQTHFIEERAGQLFDYYVPENQPFVLLNSTEERKLHFAQRCISISPIQRFGWVGSIACNQNKLSVSELNPTGYDEYGQYLDLEFAGITQRFRYIEPAVFMMGSPENEPERDDDEDLHQVTLTQGYWIADTTVTQTLWQAIMGDNPSEFKGETNPVDSVSWDDAQQFIEKLQQLNPLLSPRLPSEAEWENACRAGTQTRYSFGDEISTKYVRYTESSGRGTVETKSLPANDWGLYEMHGNVWEWCQDYWQRNLGKEPVKDPVNSKKHDYRVLRGGSWFGDGWPCRSAIRNGRTPDSRFYDYGFRLVLGHLSSGQVCQEQGGSMDDKPLRDEADKHSGRQPAEKKGIIHKITKAIKGR